MKSFPTSIENSIVTAFWSKVIIKPIDECWIWIGATMGSGNGYGCMRIKDVLYKANRMAFFISYDVDPFPFHVLHECDNTRCVNPNHLFLGTHADNMKDMKAKGRVASGENSGRYTHPDKTPKGEKHHWAVLTEKEVIEIKSLLKHLKNAEIAQKYSVSVCTIQDIRVGRSWIHI